MRGNWKRGALVAALLASTAAAGCAQDVGDIDRTQPNRVKKSDLTDGVWFMNQKVTHVPGNASLFAGFEGEMMETDKVVFVAEENYLIAYRSYPFLAGSDGDTTIPIENYDEVYGEGYKGAILAMFPIESHFDVQREYDASTGEQSNVISENTSDRPWYEREYMRVSWDSDPLVNFIWRYIEGTTYELSFQDSDDNTDPEKSPYFEYDENGRLMYFDAPTNYVVQSTRYDLYYNWFTDYKGSAEIRVVTSFARDLGNEDPLNQYEPAVYPNQDMNRFGFFRTERYTYDPKTGLVLNSGRIEHAYRHNIWADTYETDANGNISIKPIEQRKVRTIPYYIHNGVSDPVLAAMSRQVIDEWNVAFKRAVYLIRSNSDPVNYPLVRTGVNVVREDGSVSQEDVNILTTIDYWALKAALAPVPNSDKFQDIFVACEIPVRGEDKAKGIKGDDPACGEPGYVPREGDFRKNYLWLIPQRQDVGLLGYCPTAHDPLTGRSISAQAHVYTAPMNNIANNIVEHLRFFNGDFSGEGIRDADVNIASAKAARDSFIDVSQIPDKLRNGSLVSPKGRDVLANKKMKRQETLTKLKHFNYDRADAVLSKAIDTGMLSTDLDDALLARAARVSNVKSTAELSDEAKDAASLFNHLSFKKRAEMRKLKNALSAQGYCFDDGRQAGDTFGRLLEKYKNRSDYDNIYKEVRAQVFRATALHEMGHGFGLRHNHSGSYDSMNYFDKYWDLRPDDNFKKKTIDNVGDMLALYDYSHDQVAGGMLDNMYSSIMDYSSGYTTDNMGLGRYDLAAILYGYSAGTYLDRSIVDAAACSAVNGQLVVGGCKHYGKGLVEVFTENPDPTNPGVQPNYLTASNARNSLGDLAALILTHKDTTGTSTFDDQTSIGQNYLELAHYHDIFQPMIASGYNFLKNRALVRMDDYLASKTLDAKGNSTGASMIRVPYVFCTDDDRGLLRSCYVWDHGADYMEQVIDHITNYEENYWFTNFARDRYAWWPDYTWGRYYGTFMDLSDYFQNWYMETDAILKDVRLTLGGDSRLYNLVDNVNNAAINSTFNFLANVISTPEYGQFCRRQDNGELYPLSAEDEAREETSEYARNAYCGQNPEYFYIRQGEGRRRYNRYNENIGFDYSWYPLEAGHYVTSIYALEALLDNEASVIADSGDINTYMFGMYDYFKDEMTQLINHVYTEEYNFHSPRLITNNGTDTVDVQGYQTVSGKLFYPSLSPAYFEKSNGETQEYDPLTGQGASKYDSLGGHIALFGECSNRNECVASDSIADGAGYVVCSKLYKDQTVNRCIAIYNAESANLANTECPQGTSSAKFEDGRATCIPPETGDVNSLMASIANTACSATNIMGKCADGLHCVQGKCQKMEPLVESDSSYSQKVYGIFYGTILTGILGSDSEFYEQFAIYRVGSGETITPPHYYKQVTFEDPFTGQIFAANKLDCSLLTDEEADTEPACNGSVGGAAQLIEKAQRLAENYKAAYNQFYDEYYEMDQAQLNNENSATYKRFMELRYKYSVAYNELKNTIMYVNMARSIYELYGRLW